MCFSHISNFATFSSVTWLIWLNWLTIWSRCRWQAEVFHNCFVCGRERKVWLCCVACWSYSLLREQVSVRYFMKQVWRQLVESSQYWEPGNILVSIGSRTVLCWVLVVSTAVGPVWSRLFRQGTRNHPGLLEITEQIEMELTMQGGFTSPWLYSDHTRHAGLN